MMILRTTKPVIQLSTVFKDIFLFFITIKKSFRQNWSNERDSQNMYIRRTIGSE